MQQIAAHDVGLDPFNQRRQSLHGAATRGSARSHLRLSTGQSVASRTGVHPTDKCTLRDVRAHAREDFVLAI
jgi:hypothetical protein